MKTEKLIWPPDFQYAEFSGDIFCPFCSVLLKAKPLDPRPMTEEDEEIDDEADDDADGQYSCRHVGLWAFGSHEPSVNENWRKEMFMLTTAMKSQAYDGEDGYFWQEALELAIHDGDGCIGGYTARALPNFHVAIYQQFSYASDTPGQRYMTYLAIILRKKRPPKASNRAASRTS